MNEDEYEGFKVGDKVKIKVDCEPDLNTCGDPYCQILDGAVGEITAFDTSGIRHVYPITVRVHGSFFAAAKPSELTKVTDA